jgi:hypothetical protein
MTPKEKAIELYDKYAGEFNFDDTYRDYKEQSKQCALIVVDELIKQEIGLLGLSDKYVPTWWNIVKYEINKL